MKTPEQNIIELLKNKKCLFLENDSSLNNGLDLFEDILNKNKIKNKSLFNLSETEWSKIKRRIDNNDCIIFQTQWVYEISEKVKEYILSINQKKIIIEVYIYEPTWFYKPNTIHDVYIYTATKLFFDEPKENEGFFKLTNKPYWNYKNKFDK